MLLGLGAGGSLVVVGPELQLGTMRAADTGTPREQLAKQQTPREPRAAKLRFLPPARTHGVDLSRLRRMTESLPPPWSTLVRRDLSSPAACMHA